MTQLDEIEKLIGKLDTDKTRGLQSQIREVLARAQNRPPHGEADGSLDETSYNAVRKVEQQLGELARAIDAAHVAVGGRLYKVRNRS